MFAFTGNIFYDITGKYGSFKPSGQWHETFEQSQKALQEAGIADKITCPQAFAIAEKAKVSRSAVGEYCTKNKIKIRECQLGCFK